MSDSKNALIQAFNIYQVTGQGYTNFQLKNDKLQMKFTSGYQKVNCKNYLAHSLACNKQVSLDRGMFDFDSFPFALNFGHFKKKGEEKRESIIFKVSLTPNIIDNLYSIVVDRLMLIGLEKNNMPFVLRLTDGERKQYVHAFTFSKTSRNDQYNKVIVEQLLEDCSFELLRTEEAVRGNDGKIIKEDCIYIKRSGIDQAIKKAAKAFPKLLAKDKQNLHMLFKIFAHDVNTGDRNKTGIKIITGNGNSPELSIKEGNASMHFKCFDDKSSNPSKIAREINKLYKSRGLVQLSPDKQSCVIDFNYENICVLMKNISCDVNFIYGIRNQPLEAEKVKAPKAVPEVLSPSTPSPRYAQSDSGVSSASGDRSRNPSGEEPHFAQENRGSVKKRPSDLLSVSVSPDTSSGYGSCKSPQPSSSRSCGTPSPTKTLVPTSSPGSSPNSSPENRPRSVAKNPVLQKNLEHCL